MRVRTALVFLLSAGCDPTVVIGRDLGESVSDASVPDAAPDIVRGPQSGLPWPSGAHYGNDLATYLEMGEWRGRALDVAGLYPDRNSWDGVVTPGWPVDMFADFPGKLVLNEPLYPEGQGNNHDCAAGAYDTQWRKLGSFLVNKQRADTIIRLGWGPTDPTHPWCTDADPSDWLACFRRIVLAIRATDPRVRIDWSFDPIGSSLPAGGDPYDTYPGDEYVDIVGVDNFDRLPAASDEESWQAKCDGPLGLCRLIAFARAHHKQFSVGEWGAVGCGEQAGGDNPFYLRKMVETFRSHADILAYESYFDDSSQDVCSAIVADDSPLVRVRAEYLRQYGKP